MVQNQERAQFKKEGKSMFSCVLLLLFFLGVSPLVLAQNIDQEIKKIEGMQNRGAYDSARILANALVRLPSISNEQKLRALLAKQFSFYYLGRYDSLRVGMAVLENEIGESDELYPDLLFVRGIQKGEDGSYLAAIGDLLEAEKRVLARKDHEALGRIYNSLAGNFKDLEDIRNAKKYYEKARIAFQDQGNTLSVVMVYNNLGGVYRKLNVLDSALYVFGEASQLLLALKNPFLLAQNTMNMGNVYEQMGNLDQAEASFLRCLEISQTSKLQYGILLSSLNLGNLYRLKKDYVKSRDWLNKALKLASSMGLTKEKGLVLERLSWLARDTNNYKEAYAQSVVAAAIQDSLASESVKKEVQALQEKFQNEKTQNEILNLESQNLKSTLWLLAAGIGILGLIIFALYRQKRFLNEKLIAKAEREAMSKTIQVKDMELTAQALHILQIKKLLDEQTASGLLVDEEGNGVKRETFEYLHSELDNRITESNGDFYKNLLAAYPDLKPTELKLCSYLRLNLSTKELAEVLNKSARTIENTRFSIRKKMGLGPEDNLVAQLIAVEEK
jgi:tetratricopeptide (TPR) repeat protein